MRIAILGGHGKVALLAAPLLVERGHEVTSVVRNPAHVDEVEATGAAAVVADVERLDVRELTDILRGHETVVWSAGAGGGDPTRTQAVDRDAAIRSVDAAVSAGVDRYVMVSYIGARPDHGVDPDDSFFAYAEAKAAADAHLRRSGLPWVILAPSALTLEAPTGTLEAEIGRGDTIPALASGSIARANVAALLAEVVDHEPPVAGVTIACNDGDEPVEEVVARA